MLNINFTGRLTIEKSIAKSWPQHIEELKSLSSLVRKLPFDVQIWAKKSEGGLIKPLGHDDLWLTTKEIGKKPKSIFVSEGRYIASGKVNPVIDILEHIKEIMSARKQG